MMTPKINPEKQKAKIARLMAQFAVAPEHDVFEVYSDDILALGKHSLQKKIDEECRKLERYYDENPDD